MNNVLELIDGGFLGGGQTHLLSLVKNISGGNFKFTIAASGKGEFGKTVKRYGFEFEEIELPKIYRSKHLHSLEKIIKDKNIKLIHSHGGVAGMYARFYKKKIDNLKVIHTIHGIHYINSKNILRKHFSLAIERFLVPYTDCFICVSETDFKTAEKIKIIDRNKTTVIRNGIDLTKFSGNKKNKELCDRLGIDKDELVIGNISRFDYQKNQRFIILNSRGFLLKYPNAKILLAGGGKYFDECRKFAEETGLGDRFVFTGEITDPENYYSLIDIFVFPSLWEGLSISLIEAMASSCCILASDIDANKELINNNINGMIFNVHDKDDFTTKLFELSENKILRDKLSGKAFEDSGKYSDKEMSAKTENEYLKLLN